MPGSRVPLPPAVREPYTVYVNGVGKRRGQDYDVVDGVLRFREPLQKERKLSVWHWFLGAWGIGYYGKNDQVDIAWHVDGNPRIAHAVDIEPDTDG